MISRRKFKSGSAVGKILSSPYSYRIFSITIAFSERMVSYSGTGIGIGFRYNRCVKDLFAFKFSVFITAVSGK